MATDDIIFSDIAETIYDPYVITTDGSTGEGEATIRVTNYGTDDLSSMGLYVIAASNVGDVDNPAQNTPGKDYQDLLTWGTTTVAGDAASGGMQVSFDGGTTYTYVTRSAGATYTNRIILPTGTDSGGTDYVGFIEGGDTVEIDIKLEVPTSVPSGTRRLFINVVVE